MFMVSKKVRKREYKIHSNEHLNAELDYLKVKLGKHSNAQLIEEVFDQIFEVASQSPDTLQKLTVTTIRNTVLISLSPRKCYVICGHNQPLNQVLGVD
jgi:hypothetical protein